MHFEAKISMKSLIIVFFSLVCFVSAQESPSSVCHMTYHKESKQIYNKNGYVETKAEYSVARTKNQSSISSFATSTIVSDGNNNKFQFNGSSGNKDLHKQKYKILINKKGEIVFDGHTYYVLDKNYKQAKSLKSLAKYNTIKTKSQKENKFLQILEQNKELKIRTISWNNQGKFAVSDYICK